MAAFSYCLERPLQTICNSFRAKGIEPQKFARALIFVYHVIQVCCRSGGDVSEAVREARHKLDNPLRIDEVDETIDVVALTNIVANTKWTVFDPSVWQRHGGFGFASGGVI